MKGSSGLIAVSYYASKLSLERTAYSQSHGIRQRYLERLLSERVFKSHYFFNIAEIEHFCHYRQIIQTVSRLAHPKEDFWCKGDIMGRYELIRS